MARAEPPQLTGGHANNPGKQGGDDCSGSKIDLLVHWRASGPPHVLMLLLLPCMVLSSLLLIGKDLTVFEDLPIMLQIGLNDLI